MKHAELIYDNGKFYAYIKSTKKKVKLDLCDDAVKKLRIGMFGFDDDEEIDDDKERTSAEIVMLKTAVYQAQEALAKVSHFTPGG